MRCLPTTLASGEISAFCRTELSDCPAKRRGDLSLTHSRANTHRFAAEVAQCAGHGEFQKNLSLWRDANGNDVMVSAVLWAPLPRHARSLADVEAGVLEGRIADGLKYLVSGSQGPRSVRPAAGNAPLTDPPPRCPSAGRQRTGWRLPEKGI